MPYGFRRRTLAIATRLEARSIARGIVALATLVLLSSMLSLAAGPSRATENQAQSKTRLILLGTAGGPVIRPDRSQPANILVIDGHPVLVDAGDGAVQQAVKAGFNPNSIQSVFLTHLHFDHTAGLAAILAFDWASLSGAKPIAIYGPVGTAQFVQDGIRYFSLPTKIYQIESPPKPAYSDLAIVHEITEPMPEPTVILQNAYMKVTAVENSHYQTVAKEKRPLGMGASFALRFDTQDRSIVFTGDTGPSNAVTALAKGADVLVSEIIDLSSVESLLRERMNVSEAALRPALRHMEEEHLTPEEVGKMAATAQVKMLVLTHVSYGRGFHRASMLAGIRKHYSGPVVFGRDRLEL